MTKKAFFIFVASVILVYTTISLGAVDRLNAPSGGNSGAPRCYTGDTKLRPVCIGITHNAINSLSHNSYNCYG